MDPFSAPFGFSLEYLRELERQRLQELISDAITLFGDRPGIEFLLGELKAKYQELETAA